MKTRPMIGNLAWAPSPAFEEVEVLDRFNGVPTLGVFGKLGERILFWRALGYVPADDISAWVYVRLSPADERHLASADPSELLHGLIFESDEWRQVTIGMASEYRLFIEFDWNLPLNASPGDLIHEMLAFLMSSLTAVADQSTATPSRRRAARKASKAMRELAAC